MDIGPLKEANVAEWYCDYAGIGCSRSEYTGTGIRICELVVYPDSRIVGSNLI